MATVFMKWLETTPGDYDRGIELLTLYRLEPLKARIAADYIRIDEGKRPRVLEIGCGTGSLAIMMANGGAIVTAIDISPLMLNEARRKAKEQGFEDSIEFHQMDVTVLGEHFEQGSFDFVVSTLVFSEFPPELQCYTLREISKLLKPDGRFLIADEMLPERRWSSLLYWIIHLPLSILTWILTRTTTSPLRNFMQMLNEAGFSPSVIESHLGGSLRLVSARPSILTDKDRSVWETVPQLQHMVTLKTMLLDLWSFANRMLLLFPLTKVPTGLYRIGHPNLKSPVLVTGNYDLTVRRLVRHLDGKVDCWLVVADSRGINVWCAAGGGHFTADKVISAIKTSGVMEIVDHHALILPQLCANGVDGWKIRREIGWGVHWGPARAKDIPSYLAACRKKTDRMRHVGFNLKERIEMTTVALGFNGLILSVLAFIFWRSQLWIILGVTTIISYCYGIFLPWLPGQDGVIKGITLSAFTILGLWVWSFSWGHLPPNSLFTSTVGLGFLAWWVGAEFQGMSPLMRGEYGNWRLYAPIGLFVFGLYVVGKLVFGG
jgi:ubiquinone/menaquinone biosynthesis C-methylase UbiE